MYQQFESFIKNISTCVCKLGILLLISVLPITGFADSNSAYNHPALTRHSSIYLDVGIGTSSSTADVFGYTFTESGGFASVLFLGYQFNRFLAIEGGVNYLDVSSNSVAFYPVALKGILPLGHQKRFRLFGKIGPAFGSGDTELFLGIGASYMIIPNLDIAAELQGASNPFSSIGLATLNLIYYFK